MSDEPIISVPVTEPSVELMAFECKFTVESRGGVGGDWERNIGGTQSEKRIHFEGYASPALYDALIGAITEVVK